MRGRAAQPGFVEPTDWEVHVGSLRRLARGLVADANDVDDVVQDAWLASAREAEGPERQRAWRGGVVRHLVANLRRSTARRSARERRAARPEALPSAAATVARVEVLERLVRAVRALEEAYRSMVMLRSFDELAPREIARRRGVPLETVRTQIRRGVERLRAQLTADAGGDERVWLAALAPVAAFDASRISAGPPLVPLTQAMILMGAKIKSVAVVLLAAAVLVAAWRLGTEASEPPVRPAADAPQLALAHTPDVAPEQPATTPAFTDEAREPLVRSDDPEPLPVPVSKPATALVGTVRDRSGRPIEGARVFFHDEAARTGADGTYHLPWRTGTQLPVYAVAEGYAQRRIEVDALRDGERRSVDIALLADCRIEGVVRAPDGAPLAGARVGSLDTVGNVVETDASGSFVLANLDRRLARQRLFVRKDGWRQRVVELATLRGADAQVELVLDRGVSVEGYVFDRAGAPIAGAAVRIGASVHAFDLERARSAADGSFALPNIDRGATRLVVEAHGFAPFELALELLAREDRLDVEVELGPEHFVAGRVFDSAGLPLAGVRVLPRWRGDLLVGRASTDDEGRFRLEGLPNDDLELSLIPAERELAHERFAVDVVDVDDLRITLGRAGFLSGRVVDAATGAPVRSFRVRLVAPELTDGEVALAEYRSVWSSPGVSFDAADGRWVGGADTNFEAGGVTGLEVVADGYAITFVPRAVARPDPVPDDLVIGLERGVGVTGVVRDRESARPIEGARVRLQRARDPDANNGLVDDHDLAFEVTDASGGFRFERVEAGTYRLVAEADGSERAVDGPFEVFRIEGNARTLELAGSPARSGS